MIKIDNLGLVKFAQDVYELSTPQGLGFLHAQAGGLSEEAATELVARQENNPRIALDMDYVSGRACKMTVFETEDGYYEVPDSWYDHTESQYDELLKRHDIIRNTPTTEKTASGSDLGVPAGCTLNPVLQMAVMVDGREHPCDRCNMDRDVCKGYARKAR